MPIAYLSFYYPHVYVVLDWVMKSQANARWVHSQYATILSVGGLSSILLDTTSREHLAGCKYNVLNNREKALNSD